MTTYIDLKLTLDQFANIQSALEEYIERLNWSVTAETGDYDSEDDVEEVIESAQSALAYLNARGANFFKDAAPVEPR